MSGKAVFIKTVMERDSVPFLDLLTGGVASEQNRYASLIKPQPDGCDVIHIVIPGHVAPDY